LLVVVADALLSTGYATSRPNCMDAVTYREQF